MILSSRACNEDTEIADVKKSVAAMEKNLKRLTQKEEEYAAELDAAAYAVRRIEGTGKKADLAELSEQRAVLQPDTCSLGQVSFLLHLV